MKKKLQLGLILATTIFSLTGCCLSHEWQDETCTSPRICTECGKEDGEALGHDWSDATCTTPKTCKTCEVTEGKELGHEWVEATCTAPKTCKVCGETEGKEVHEWVGATCTSPRECSICNTTQGQALGHKWTEATCENPKSCSRCGTTEGNKLGHDLDVGDGRCNVCGKQLATKIDEYNFDEYLGVDHNLWSSEQAERSHTIYVYPMKKGKYEGSVSLEIKIYAQEWNAGRWEAKRYVSSKYVTVILDEKGNGEITIDDMPLYSNRTCEIELSSVIACFTK